MRNSTAKAFTLFSVYLMAWLSLHFLYIFYVYVLSDFPIYFPLTLPTDGLRNSRTLRMEAPVVAYLSGFPRIIT